METMRDLLRGNLAGTLRGIREEDRLAAAWTVACGKAMADHGTVIGFAQGIVRIEVADAAWMQQMLSLRGVLARDMARIAGLPVAAIEFELAKRPNTDRHRGHGSKK
ncbi:MAG TPA: DciA family protein [Acidobacteriaceae bacterium]